MPVLIPDPATPLAGLLRRQHGVISWRQARRHLTESAVNHRVTSGRWRRIHLGVYLTYAGPVTRIQRWWVASLAVGNGRPALLAGPTALRVHGLRFPRAAEPVHLLLPVHLTDRDPPPGVVVHRTRQLSRDDACVDMSPPCTTAARSLVDAAQWALDDTTAISLIAATFQQRLVTLEQVRTVLATHRRLRRRSVIMSAVADAGGGSESAYEIEFLRLCRLAGLPLPSRQAARRDRSGRSRYRDVFFDPWRVQVEIDGSQHMETRAWFADMRSGNEIAISGVRLLRFPGWAVRHRPTEVIADVRAALEAAGWREDARPARSTDLAATHRAFTPDDDHPATTNRPEHAKTATPGPAVPPPTVPTNRHETTTPGSGVPPPTVPTSEPETTTRKTAKSTRPPPHTNPGRPLKMHSTTHPHKQIHDGQAQTATHHRAIRLHNPPRPPLTTTPPPNVRLNEPRRTTTDRNPQPSA